MTVKSNPLMKFSLLLALQFSCIDDEFIGNGKKSILRQMIKKKQLENCVQKTNRMKSKNPRKFSIFSNVLVSIVRVADAPDVSLLQFIAKTRVKKIRREPSSRTFHMKLYNIVIWCFFFQIKLFFHVYVH